MSLSPRLRRALERAYGVEGVVGVRISEWPGEPGAGLVALGVRVTPTASPSATLRRVELGVAMFREPGETWELGLLTDDLLEPALEPDAA